MGDKRKLQAEIDRCLKKVGEGVEAFDDIWKKVHASNNTNQKEKFEADLKKEIKKLQRLRDQIKTWLVCADIKDKQVLIENRKLIEQQMERFKVIERETKTKAYSKEGLVATGKVDPKEKKKEDITSWLSVSINELNVQIDRLESEMEAMTNKKKKLDKDEQSRYDTIKEVLIKHRHHVNKLEAILRKVDNGAVQFSKIESIQQDVDYYIESNQEADFEENEFIYDELDLEDAPTNLRMDALTSSPSEGDTDATGLGTAPSSNHSGSPSPSSGASTHSKKSEEETKKRLKTPDDTIQPTGKTSLTLKMNLTETTTVSNSVSMSRLPQTPTKSNTLGSVPSTPTSASVGGVRPTTTAVSVPGLGYAQVAGSHHSIVSGKAAPTVAKSHVGGANGLIVMSQTLMQSIAQTAAANASGHSSSISSSSLPSLSLPTTVTPTATSLAPSMVSDLPLSSLSGPSPSSSSVVMTMAPAPSPSPLPGSVSSSSSAPAVSQPLQLAALAQQQQRLQQAMAENDARRTVNGFPNNVSHALQNELNNCLVPSQLKSVLNHEVQDQQRSSLETSTAPLSQPHLEPSLDMPSSLQLSALTLAASGDQLQQQQQSQQQQQQPPNQPSLTSTFIKPILGVSPLGPQLMTEEQALQLRMLDTASLHVPLHTDSESVR